MHRSSLFRSANLGAPTLNVDTDLSSLMNEGKTLSNRSNKNKIVKSTLSAARHYTARR